MSQNRNIPENQRNHLTATEVSDKTLGRLIAMHGWEIGVMFYYKEGEEGGMGVTCAGLGLRNGKIAQEFMRRIIDAVGMEMDTSEIDKEIDAAKKEMAEGPEGGDPNTGRIVMGESLEKVGKDKLRQRKNQGKRIVN